MRPAFAEDVEVQSMQDVCRFICGVRVAGGKDSTPDDSWGKVGTMAPWHHASHLFQTSSRRLSEDLTDERDDRSLGIFFCGARGVANYRHIGAADMGPPGL